MTYLDHAAATPVSARALEAMLPFFSEDFFNPSAPYLPAKHVRDAYEAAKAEIAHTIGAKAADLVITAGATESINLAFTALQALDIAGNSGSSESQVRILAPATEHAAVLAAAGPYGLETIRVDQYGLIDIADLKAKITDDVALISVSLANNELGTIQPLGEIAELIRRVRQERFRRDVKTPLLLHSDASQALNLLDISVARLGVDLLTLNAAKCGGPKGVGALYVAHGVQLSPLNRGGGQERGLRSGTENVPGVIGFAAAITEAAKHQGGNRKKYLEMKTVILKELKKARPDLKLLGHPKHQLASFLPVCFPGIDAERLIYRLEQEEIYLSTGAACAANKGTKSHVLAAIGLSDEEIAGSVRISLGNTNTLEDVRLAGQKIAAAVTQEYERMRR